MIVISKLPPSTLGRLIDANKFNDWIEQAKPGEHICYFRGELAWALGCEPDQETIRVAQIALRLQRDDQVCLTQWRAGEHCYEYYATKRHVPGEHIRAVDAPDLSNNFSPHGYSDRRVVA